MQHSSDQASTSHHTNTLIQTIEAALARDPVDPVPPNIQSFNAAERSADGPANLGRDCEQTYLDMLGVPSDEALLEEAEHQRNYEKIRFLSLRRDRDLSPEVEKVYRETPRPMRAGERIDLAGLVFYCAFLFCSGLIISSYTIMQENGLAMWQGALFMLPALAGGLLLKLFLGLFTTEGMQRAVRFGLISTGAVLVLALIVSFGLTYNTKPGGGAVDTVIDLSQLSLDPDAPLQTPVAEEAGTDWFRLLMVVAGLLIESIAVGLCWVGVRDLLDARYDPQPAIHRTLAHFEAQMSRSRDHVAKLTELIGELEAAIARKRALVRTFGQEIQSIAEAMRAERLAESEHRANRVRGVDETKRFLEGLRKPLDEGQRNLVYGT